MGFFIDLVLSLISLWGARQLGFPTWGVLVEYWITFAALRLSDRWAVKRGWGLVRRAAIKVVILLAVDVLSTIFTIQVVSHGQR